MHCRNCGGVRGTTVVLSAASHGATVRANSPRATGKVLPPGSTALGCLFQLLCGDCRTSSVGLLFQEDGGTLAHAIFPTGSIATPKTRDEVRFYLDQAARCEQAAAFSAALPMYRAALEMLLHHEGYTKGMLGARLKAVDEDRDATEQGTKKRSEVKPWVLEVDRVSLDAIKKLGDGAIHPNDGDIARQDVMDAELCRVIAVAFEGLLESVYERPARLEERQQKLTNAANVVKKQ